MSNFSVVESQGGSISELMIEKLRKIKASGCKCAGEQAIAMGTRPDLLVVSSKSANKQNIPETSCQILLLPGEAKHVAGKLKADCVVSYGLGAKDSISLSSINKDSLVMSIQRSIPTVSGQIIEPQEIPIHQPSNVSTDDALASAAALLLLGTDPQCLK